MAVALAVILVLSCGYNMCCRRGPSDPMFRSTLLAPPGAHYVALPGESVNA